jgi:hypothetical protein
MAAIKDNDSSGGWPGSSRRYWQMVSMPCIHLVVCYRICGLVSTSGQFEFQEPVETLLALSLGLHYPD